jgi:hypothetical protein
MAAGLIGRGLASSKPVAFALRRLALHHGKAGFSDLLGHAAFLNDS